MDHWVIGFKEKLDKLGITLRLLKKYMDDVLIVANNHPLGTRLAGEVLTCLPEHVEEDRRNNITREELPMEILNQVANGVLPFMDFI